MMRREKYIAIQLFTGRFIAIFIWFLITVVQWTNNPKSSPGLAIPIIVRAVEALAVLLVSEAVIFTIGKVWRFFAKRNQAMIVLFVAFYFFAIAANVISITVRGLIGFAPPKIDGYFFIQSLHFYVPLYLVIAIHYLVKNRIDLKIEKENKLKAEALAEQAKWMMLRYQVNPHFLFNTLNSIRALIGYDDDKARKVVTEMSDYFRYSLSIEKNPLVPIREEISAVDNFLEIQKIRYPDRLIIKKDIYQDTHKCLIPVFSIQTLVENATKYGLKTHSGNVTVELSVKKDENNLIIQVANTGKLVYHTNEQNGDGTNTGIENLKNRLNFLDNEFKFDLQEKKGKVIATIELKDCNEYENLESNNS